MGQIHDLVTRHGRLEAKKLVPADDARLVDLAAEVLGDENVTMGFTYSGFCMASLPHRALDTDKEWIRKSDDFSLIIEPGKLFRHGEEEGTAYGVPFGPRASDDHVVPSIRSDPDELPRSRARRQHEPLARAHEDRRRRQDLQGVPRAGTEDLGRVA